MRGRTKDSVDPLSFWVRLFVVLVVLIAALPVVPGGTAAAAGTLLSADFNADANGFVYADDVFGTSQAGYASGTRVTTAGYGGTGGLQVSLGGVNANVISGMSGGWTATLNVAAAEAGVKLAFRYKVDQTVAYEYDEYTRMRVKVDGVEYGRGVKSYVDHIGGDGSSSQGNSSTYLPTTNWQQAEIYLGTLGAGSHTIVLGGFNNKKDAADESSTLTIDDVVVTSGNAAPVATAAETLAGRVDMNQYLNFVRGVAQYDDRCRGSNMGCSSTDYSTNYMNALTWVEGQLQAMGYTTQRHSFNYNGNTGTNLWATKVGSVTPTQMYMVSAHLDGRGGGDAFNDDGSGVGLVLEAARVLAAADVTTDKSVRFIFWDKEELGLYGANGYVQDRRSLQGTASEPTWLGLIQHDMIMYDHGAGTRTTAQSLYADMDVEWRAGTTKAADSQALALKWSHAAGRFAPDYPATAYNYSTNTDDTPFHPYVASVSVRENRRSLTSGGNAEWINPYYHTTGDVESSFTRDDDGDGKRDDIELAANTVRTTLGLVAELAGAQIAGSNTAPAANGQAVTTAEDTAKALILTGSDADGDPLTFRVTANPAHGALSGTAPNLTYTPASNYNGSDSFAFVANDGSVDSAPATVAITISPVNDAPVANAQAVSTNEDTAKAITLSGSDIDGNPLTYTIVSNPGKGVLSGAPPNVTYTSAANSSGADSFTFKVNDGVVDSAAATVSITVNPVNDAPVANAQTATTDEDAPVAIVLVGSDVEGSPLTYAVVSAPSHGTLSGAAPNLTYTPAANYFGTDSLTFKVNDGSVDSAPAAVGITINAVNDAPAADAQTVATAQNTPVAFTLSGSDVEDSPLAFNVLTNPQHGSLSGAAPNLTYTPDPGYQGADSFSFSVSDGQASSDPAVVSILVTEVNQPPVADGQAAATAEDAAVAISLTGSDPEGEPLAFIVVNGPANGSLSGDAPNLVYAPAANFHGSDSFTFKVNDGMLDSAEAVVSINVAPANDAPVAGSQAVVVAEDAAVAITLSGSDVDGDVLSYALTGAPAYGALTGVPPSLTYTPQSDYNGSDSFTFVVNDGLLDSAPALVNVTVTPVNDAPTAEPQTAVTAEDSPVAITLAASDPDGDALSYPIVNPPAHGVLTGSGPDYTYTPAANYYGEDSFTFSASDGQAASAVQLVSLTVTPVNDAPVANSQQVTLAQDSSAAITLNGSDAEGDALTYNVTAAPASGTLSGAAPNLTYTPDAGYSGPDSFSFVVSDGESTSTPAIVNITVNAPGPVVVFEDNFETNQGWTRNPSGADNATSGLWERADPQDTNSSGAKQLGTAASGSYDLVTGPLAGSNSGTYDIDGGLTSMRSPAITLPAGKDLTLTLKYYLAHGTNSSSADYLRVKVVGTSTSTVLVETGANNDDDAVWAEFTGNISSFAGQTVYLLVEAADASGASLVEAAIDDVAIVASTAATPILQASFDGGAEGFTYADDTFRSTVQPTYASGSAIATGGYSGGALRVYLGGVNNNTISNMSGGWRTTINLAAAQEVIVSFRYAVNQSPEYESDEYSQALLSADGALFGTLPNDFIASVYGDGNGGSAISSGWALYETSLGVLGAGAHTLTFGGFNSKKTYANEWTEVLIDDVSVSTR